MKLKRALAIAAVCGALAALLSSAATSFTGTRRVPAAPLPKRGEVEATGAELASEIARLRDRLHPTVAPQRPARDLFAFSVAPAARVVAPPPPVVEPASTAPERPAVLSIQLVGIAEDAGADGPVRTAILSGSGELFVVKEGDAVTARYRVEAITSDGADLRGIDDGRVLHLDLK